MKVPGLIGHNIWFPVLSWRAAGPIAVLGGKDHTMEICNNGVPSSTWLGEKPAASCRARACQSKLVAVTGSQWLDLSLVTKEGDKVTLSADAKT